MYAGFYQEAASAALSVTDDEDKSRLRELNRRRAELKGSGVSPLRPGA
jgi:hypothetical protein